MVFWRKKKNETDQEEDARAQRALHRANEPDIEPPVEYDSDIDFDLKHAIEQTDNDILEDLALEPVPRHNKAADAAEHEALDEDHEAEGGWLSRLSRGLSKSTNKMTRGLSDLLTKRKLDQPTLEALEDLLITADLGPHAAAKIIEDFSATRFGQEIEEYEIREALAESMAAILGPVAAPLEIVKPSGGGPFVVLMCGVNGAGKTTTIGKLAHQWKKERGFKVVMAAADTFRAAAVEQLEVWSQRVGCPLVKKEIGADAAAVAYEAYERAKKDGADVLLIDTAGRLQNKKNLMEELSKIVRVLQKQDESLPHAALLVLDSTTGQNAFSQLQTFKDMVNITGLIVTKLDGSAKGGVLVGLAERFGIPVHAIGIGENLEDMQPFNAREYARSLMGLEV